MPTVYFPKAQPAASRMPFNCPFLCNASVSDPPPIKPLEEMMLGTVAQPLMECRIFWMSPLRDSPHSSSSIRVKLTPTANKAVFPLVAETKELEWVSSTVYQQQQHYQQQQDQTHRMVSRSSRNTTGLWTRQRQRWDPRPRSASTTWTWWRATE